MFFFLAYFTLYNRLQFHPSHQHWFKWILFNGWVILHCVYVPQLSYPFICWWTSGLFPCPGYYKYLKIENKKLNNIHINRLYVHVCVLSHFNHVWLFATLWTIAHQAPQSMAFFRQEYWSGFSWSPSGYLPDPGIEPMSPTLKVDSFHWGSPSKPYKEQQNIPKRDRREIQHNWGKNSYPKK